MEKIIKDNISDEMHIQRKLDEMLDILLFRRLCKYYFSINPQVTAQLL